MKGIYSDCIESLKKDDLYDCFMWIAEASCKKLSKLNWIDVHPVPMNEAVEILKEHAPTISRELLKDNIQSLIFRGLLKYSEHDIDYIDNFEDTVSQVHEKEYERSLREFQCNITDDSKIELSQQAQISGQELYREIMGDREEKQFVSQLGESLKEALDESAKEYIDYVDETKNNLEKRLKDIENSTIKSIEIISVFAAIISLLVVNMNSIATFAEKGLSSILLVNTSTIVCIFFLLLFTRVIICGKGAWKELIKWFLVMIVFVGLMLFLIA